MNTEATEGPVLTIENAAVQSNPNYKVPDNLPQSLRVYHHLKPIDLELLKEAKSLQDMPGGFIIAPLGGQVQVGSRLSMEDPFEIDQMMMVPAHDREQLLMYSQVPLMVDEKPPVTLDPMNMLGFGRIPNSDDVIMSFHNTEKNTEMVLAVHSQDFLQEVIFDQNTRDVPNFVEDMLYNNLSFVRRDWCETDPRYMQLLPYIVLYKIINDEFWIFVYQRGKESDEGRIALSCSIGIGGHINPHDFLNIVPNLMTADRMDDGFTTHAIHGVKQRVVTEGFWTGIWNNIRRELGEEVVIVGKTRNHDIEEILEAAKPKDMSMEQFIHSKTVFFSDYQSGDVEKVHLAMFMAVEIPAEYEVSTNESVLVDVGFVKLKELICMDGRGFIPTPLEVWSRSIIKSLERTLNFNKEHSPTVYGNNRGADNFIAAGKHCISAEDLEKIPQAARWSIGTLAQIFGREYKYFAMNTFLRP